MGPTPSSLWTWGVILDWSVMKKIRFTAHFWTKFYAPIIWLCDKKKFYTVHNGGPCCLISFSSFHSSVLDIFYEPTICSPGSSTEEVQTVAVNRNTCDLKSFDIFVSHLTVFQNNWINCSPLEDLKCFKPNLYFFFFKVSCLLNNYFFYWKLNKI